MTRELTWIFIDDMTSWLFAHLISLQVKLSVIWEYIKSCTLKMGLLIVLFYVCYNSCGVGANIWLAKWSTDEDEEAENKSLTTLVDLAAVRFIATMHANSF